MTTLPAVQQYGFGEMEKLADAMARSNLFGMKTKEQALVLMAISQAEGKHPALAARDYSIIQGRAAKNAEAMQRDFFDNGGRIEWHQLDDDLADATFSHQQGGTVRISWDMERARKAGLSGKDMYGKYTRQMLRARTISEGVRTIYPGATSGLYTPEEVAEFDQPRRSSVVVPLKQEIAAPVIEQAAPAETVDPATGEVTEAAPVAEVPYFLPVPKAANGQTNFPEWGRAMIKAIKASTTDVEVDEWLAKNAFTASNCEEAAPKAFKSVMACAEAKKRELGAEYLEG